jgi:hypothetical protein
MQWKQHVAQAHAVADRLLEHLHVLIAIQTGEVANGLADVGDLERFADGGLEQTEDLRNR